MTQVSGCFGPRRRSSWSDFHAWPIRRCKRFIDRCHALEQGNLRPAAQQKHSRQSAELLPQNRTLRRVHRRSSQRRVIAALTNLTADSCGYAYADRSRRRYEEEAVGSERHASNIHMAATERQKGPQQPYVTQSRWQTHRTANPPLPQRVLSEPARRIAPPDSVDNFPASSVR